MSIGAEGVDSLDGLIMVGKATGMHVSCRAHIVPIPQSQIQEFVQ